jgi:hypothetical protein
MDLTYLGIRRLSLLLVADSPKAARQEFISSADLLNRNVCEAAALILAQCRQLAWCDPDIDELARLRTLSQFEP